MKQSNLSAEHPREFSCYKPETALPEACPNLGRTSARLTVDAILASRGFPGISEEAHQAYLTAKRELHSACTI